MLVHLLNEMNLSKFEIKCEYFFQDVESSCQVRSTDMLCIRTWLVSRTHLVLASSILFFLTCPSSSSLSLTDKISQTLLDASKTLQEEPSQISRFLLSYPLSYPCQNSEIWFFLPNLPHLSSVTDLSFQSWDIPNMLQHLFRNLVFGEKNNNKKQGFPHLEAQSTLALPILD